MALRITDIYTGRGVLPGKRAIIYAPRKAEDGDLAQLTEFLKQRGLEVHTGYSDSYTLHVGGFGSDNELRRLLTEDFPQWEGHKGKPGVVIEKDAPFIPLDRDQQEERGARRIHRFLKHYSSSLAGVAATVAGGSLFVQAASQVRHAQANGYNDHKPMLNLIAASFFVTAAALLAVLGYRNARQPSATEIVEGLERQLDAEYVMPDQRSFGRAVRSTIAAMERNPWLVASMLNAAGGIIKTANHLVPAVQRYDRSGRVRFLVPGDTNSGVRRQNEHFELAGALFGFISLGLIALAPRQQNNTLLGMEGYLRSPEGRAQVEQATATPGSGRLNLHQAPEKKRGRNNMLIAGALGATSNILFGIMGMRATREGLKFPPNTHRHKEAKSNGWLIYMLPFNLVADYFTSISKPSFTHSIDEIASEAAALLKRRQDDGTLKRPLGDEIIILAELLASQPAIAHDAKPIREAITEQLERRFGIDKTYPLEISNEYHYLDRVSPFTVRQPFAVAERNRASQMQSDREVVGTGRYTARAASDFVTASPGRN